MTREDDIVKFLRIEEGDILFDKHERLTETARLLQQRWTYERRREYHTILTGFNYEITEVTGLTSPADLAIARRLIEEAYNQHIQYEHMRGCF